MARDEDLGSGDVTSAILPAEVMAHAQFRARQAMDSTPFTGRTAPVSANSPTRMKLSSSWD